MNQYPAYARRHAAKSPLVKDCILAFLVGGSICALGEGLYYLFSSLSLQADAARTGVSITLIGTAALLTGFDLFDSIAKFAGAGTLVPITGFANAVVSCAIDNRDEGLVLGVGAKIFTVSGPVILYGTLAGVLYGIILLLGGFF